jgi:hypothetical protein
MDQSTRLNISCVDQWNSTGGTRRHLRGYVDYTICITCIMYQQLWGYKVEEKLYLGVREQKRLNTTGVNGFILLSSQLSEYTQRVSEHGF